MASWSVDLSLDQVVWVRVLARDIVVVFLGKRLYSDSASFHPGVQMGTHKFNTEVNPSLD